MKKILTVAILLFSLSSSAQFSSLYRGQSISHAKDLRDSIAAILPDYKVSGPDSVADDVYSLKITFKGDTGMAVIHMRYNKEDKDPKFTDVIITGDHSTLSIIWKAYFDRNANFSASKEKTVRIPTGGIRGIFRLEKEEWWIR